MAAAAPERIRGLERIAENRSRSRILMLLFAFAALPSVVLFVQFAVALILMLAGLVVDLPRSVEYLVVALAILIAYPIVLYLIYSHPKELVLRLAGARPAGALEDEFQHAVADLSKRMGVPKPSAYVIESASPNTFSTGLDPAHAAIVVTTGLLQLLNPAEREAVLAHEFSHIVNLDTRVSTLSAAMIAVLRLPWDIFRNLRPWILRRAKAGSEYSVVYSVTMSYIYGTVFFAALLTWILPLWSLVYWFGDRSATIFAILSPSVLLESATEAGETLVWLMLIPAWVLLVAPMLAPLLRSFTHFTRELLADADAASLTGSPDGIIGALCKLKGARSQELPVHRAIGHLCIVDPAAHALGVASATHPQIEQRIARAGDAGSGISAHTAKALEEMGASHSGRDVHVSADPNQRAAPRVDSNVGTQYCLRAPAELLETPDPKSIVLLKLPAGAQVVVFEKSGRFFQTVSQSGVFGFLPVETPMQRLDGR